VALARELVVRKNGACAGADRGQFAVQSPVNCGEGQPLTPTSEGWRVMIRPRLTGHRVAMVSTPPRHHVHGVNGMSRARIVTGTAETRSGSAPYEAVIEPVRSEDIE
jgi:hypothetical protein